MKKLFKKAIVTAIAVVMVLSLAACGSPATKESSSDSEKDTPSSANTETKLEKKLTIGYSLFDFANPYFIAVTQGMKDICDEMGIDLIIHDAKSDVAAQVAAVENFVAQRVDAIIISPLDVIAMEPIIANAIDAGIPVINLNQEIKGRSAHVGMSEYEFGFTGGKIAGQWIKDNLTEPAKVAVLGYPSLAPLVERANGLKEGMLALAPDAEIVNEQTAGTPDQGMAVAETILQANPDVNVLICINDGGALGAYEAFVAAGKDKEKVCIVGLDATEEALRKIKEGGIYVGTVDIDGYGTGRLGVETTLKVLESGPIEEMVEIKCIPVTKDNIDDYIK
ncbi:MAG TPA: sugar ABC transporter substrate-binding protein [Clostridiaceae bacterium]|nr:sugar ABC transporter substrate-binding protein [Clostridiaceae bacterium]